MKVLIIEDEKLPSLNQRVNDFIKGREIISINTSVTVRFYSGLHYVTTITFKVEG